MLLDDIYISFVDKTYQIFLQLENMFGVCYNFATSVQYFYCLYLQHLAAMTIVK